MRKPEAGTDWGVYGTDSSVSDKLELTGRAALQVWYSGETPGLKIKTWDSVTLGTVFTAMETDEIICLNNLEIRFSEWYRKRREPRTDLWGNPTCRSCGERSQQRKQKERPVSYSDTEESVSSERPRGEGASRMRTGVVTASPPNQMGWVWCCSKEVKLSNQGLRLRWTPCLVFA